MQNIGRVLLGKKAYLKHILNKGVAKGVAFDPHAFSVQCENRDQLTHRALYCSTS